MPFSRLTGAEIADASGDRATGRLEVRAELCTAGGILHGGDGLRHRALRRDRVARGDPFFMETGRPMAGSAEGELAEFVAQTEAAARRLDIRSSGGRGR